MKQNSKEENRGGKDAGKREKRREMSGDERR